MAFEGNTTPYDMPDTDTVYITGLPATITEEDLAEYFGSIGVIKIDKKARRPKIWLYRDKATGGLKGDGTVTYEDPFAASSAVEWFNNKEFKGSILSVSLAEKREPTFSRGGRGGRGYRGGGGRSYGQSSYGDRGRYDDRGPPQHYSGGGRGGGDYGGR
eukprot:evm.model.scf_427.1 EVM.evm.TU.scf_427.1   scf_427:17526-18888(-)